MTDWARRHFRLPYLAADVSVGARPGEVQLRDGERTTVLSVDGDVESARALLSALTEPDGEVWAELDDGAPAALAELVADLDRFGWLREGDDSGRARRDQRERRLDALVARARSWLEDAGAADDPGVHDASLAGSVLAVCRRVWRRSSPLTDRVLALALDGAPTPAASAWDTVALAISDLRDVEQQVWTALQLAVIARPAPPGPPAPRHPDFVPPTLADGPGVNVLIAAEGCAEALLASLGEPALHRLVDGPGGAGRAAPVVFQHRWFETIRYVEAVAGFLRFRLGRDLAALVLSYLREEMGHEVHEAETCDELAISRDELAAFAPLAWFGAYPELLADLAERRPLAFLLAMTVAEGLPGGGIKLTERLAVQGGGGASAEAHDEIDRRLGHEMVTRTMLSQLDWVEAGAAADAITAFLRVVEIAHAGWEMLSRYVAAGLPDRPRPFALTAQAIAALCAPGSPPIA